MKSLKALTCLAVISILQAMPGQAAERPVLRPHVSTVEHIVTVGDFYENAGSVADTPLFRSPDLGTTGSVPADLVARRAKAAGLENASTDGLEKVSVYRRADVYDAERLASIIADNLASRDATLSPDDLEITFFRTPSSFKVSATTVDPIIVDNVLWSRSNNRFNVVLRLDVGGSFSRLELSGYAMETVEVLALARPIGKGDIIRDGDFTHVRLAKSLVPANVIHDKTEVIGLAARQRTKANVPLMRQNFERPILVARGDKVTLAYHLPGMKLTTRGQAVVEGAIGDVIDVMNTQSRRIVQAEVIGRGQVRVLTSTPIVASLQGVNQ